ncbi:MAG: TnsA-like heteromeric transposase endonuclease subunit [Microbacterium gubbeenense]
MDLEVQWGTAEASGGGEAILIEFKTGGVRRELDAADVADVPFELADPVRTFPSWQGKRNYEGTHAMTNVSRSVPFESLTERSCLIELDRLPDVVGVSSQPMWIRWRGDRDVRHAPDYFVRREDGSAVLIDVRPHARIDDAAREKFNRTRATVARLGWNYVVYDGASPVRQANLRFLMRYSGEAWRADTGHLSPGSRPLGQIAGELGGGAEGLGRCYHLVWRGEVAVALDEPLSLRATAQVKGQL